MKKIISLLVMVLLLAGCGNSGGSKDTYNFSSTLAVQSLDSSLATDGMSMNAIHAAIDGLMGKNAKGEIVEALAESYKVSEDGLTYTFKLRDAKWSNGDKVTANDFVYAWQRIINVVGDYSYLLGEGGANIVGAQALINKQAEVAAAGGKLTQADLDTLGAKAIDEKTLEVKLTKKVQFFNELMSFACFFPLNKKFVESKGDQYGKNGDAFISNGAFKVEKWELGSKVSYVKNEDYWNAKEVKLKKLVLTQVGDVKTGVAAFEAGTVDFAELTSDLVNKYKGKDVYKTFAEGYLYFLTFNTVNKDLANPNIRKAFSLAINREDIANNILKDGSKPAGGFVPSDLAKNPSDSSKDFRGENGTLTEYSLEKAQAALDAGLKELGKTEVTLEFLYGSDEAPMDTIATYLQNAFAKLKGLKVNLVATAKKDRLQRLRKGDYSVSLTRWGPDFADPTTYLDLLVSNNVSYNFGKYNSKKYDELISKVRSESDASKRWSYMLEAEKVMLADYPVAPVVEKGASTLVNTKTKGLVHSSTGIPYTFNYISVE